VRIDLLISVRIGMISENSLLQTGTIASADPFYYSNGLNLAHRYSAMRHSSDGQPRHHRPMKLVAMGER
jgi:hypothetical protein